jgi:hypothetical protein
VDPVITSITLTGAGDGHMFFFELEMAAAANVDGGADVVGVQFLLSATAEDLQEQIGALQSLSPVLDVQIAGAAKGQRVMGLVVSGTLRPDGGGAIAPWSLMKIVDSLTAVPLGDQDGSVAAPYSTIQGAIDANQGVALGLSLVASTYSENVVVPAGSPVVFFPALSTITSLTLDPAAVVSFSGGTLTLTSMTLGDGSSLTFSCEVLCGASTLGAGAVLNSYINIVLIGLMTLGNGCQVQFLGRFVINGGVATSDPSDSGTLIFACPDHLESNLPGTVSVIGAANASAYALRIVGAQLYSGLPLLAGSLVLEGCSVGGNVDVTVAGDVVLNNTSVSGGAWSSLGRVRLIAATVGAATWNNAVGQPFELDSFSNYWIKILGTVLTNPAEKVITSDVVP